MFEVSIDEVFPAGHALRNYHGKCENVHGHNYRVRVTAAGPSLDGTGLLVDFAELKRLVRAVKERLDHQFLNDLPPFDEINPSAENIAKHFYDEIKPALSQLTEVKIWETDVSCATYRP
ncbi:MAG: 6-carboxytetrahydropterin synthase QueD [Acidobacteriota bacterium]|nr:6-carboxytetrahydropterin synthase QueD [Acidobacteriota bacterium]